MTLVERVREWWQEVKWKCVKRMIDATIADNGFAYAYLHDGEHNQLICIYRGSPRHHGQKWRADIEDFHYHYVYKAVYGTFILTRTERKDLVLYDRWKMERHRRDLFNTDGDKIRETLYKALYAIEGADEENDPWIPVLTDPNGVVWGLSKHSNIRRMSDETTFVLDMFDPRLREYPNRRHAPACFKLDWIHTYPGQWKENPGPLVYQSLKKLEELKIQVVVERVTGDRGFDLEVLTDVDGSHLMDVHRYRVTVLANQKLPKDKKISPYFVNKKIMEFLRDDIPGKILITDNYVYQNVYRIDSKMEGGEYATEKF